jgi:hypothetical protein
VDNSNGAEAEFVAGLRAALSAAGFDVEVRDPSPQAIWDTSVHFVIEGVSVRVPSELSSGEIDTVAAAVREAETHRRSERKRTRAVPIYEGESRRVLVWVDVFG